MTDEEWVNEISAGKRFEFGKNWEKFLCAIDDTRIAQAVQSLKGLLGGKTHVGGRFLDVGSGSGLISLAARRLGFHVVSFDYDPGSVECTRQLKARHYSDDPLWQIKKGSVLDESFLRELGKFDIVYSWGVLHHTGDMWQSLENLLGMVTDGGLIVLALYNDQGVWSRFWKSIKRVYNVLPSVLKNPFVFLIMGPRELSIIAVPLLKGKFSYVVKRWSEYGSESGRGMSKWRDAVDWVGGYPFEVCKPEEVFYFCRERRFTLTELRTCRGELGCNEFVFEKRCIE